jgi:hypothetical protein
MTVIYTFTMTIQNAAARDQSIKNTMQRDCRYWKLFFMRLLFWLNGICIERLLVYVP